MVKALLELDDETNRILNVIKAKHGLRDKSQVIEYMAQNFKEGEAPITFRYMHDGDRWMLAEEIPDVHFSFCEIWLSSFVDQFETPGGRAYKKVLAVFNGYKMKFYYGTEDSDEVAAHLVNRFIAEPAFIEQVNKEIINTADKLRAYCETLPERNLDRIPNNEIWEMFEKHDELHTVYYKWGWIPNASDMFHNNFTESLKKHLANIGVEEDKVNEYLVTLTTPRKKSPIQIQREEFLRLASDINKDPFHKKLFEELFRQFKEQEVAKLGYKTHTKEYEELLEKKMSDLIIEIKPEILDKIRAHYRKYFYVNHMWVGTADTFEHYLKELVKLIGNNSDVAATLQNEEKEFQDALSKRNELMKKLGIKGDWEKIFDGFGDFMITKIYRRFAQIYAAYKTEFLQREIARRFNLTIKHVRFLMPHEVKELLLYGKLDREELDRRTVHCVYYSEKGKQVMYTGVKAKQLEEDASKVEVADVKEIHGQVGCLGKARGIVRQIFRPEDMTKMNRGDILVSIATDPDIVPAMKKAGAIVTEQGGVTSHAAIVSRELGVPCVIGTKIATKVLHDGDFVEVDAEKGIVRILEKGK